MNEKLCRTASKRRAFVTAVAAGTLLLAPGCYDGRGESDGGADGADDGPADAPDNAELTPDSVARRMSQSELDNIIEDLLGDDTRPAAQFLSEDEFTPFDNDYELQVASQTLVESLEVMATDVADRLIADPARRAQVVPCTPTGADDAACFRQFIETFGRMAYRRPLSTAEVDALMSLQSFATESNAVVQNDFWTGVGLVVQAVLQDPEVLYRIEVGTPTTVPGVFKLSDFEIATRMSFLLWGSTPDDELLTAAENGGLDDPTARAAIVARMLDTERAKQQLYRYHAMWLGYRTIPHEAQLVGAFNSETTALIDRVVFDGSRSYLELFTSNETYVDDFLAGHYGLPAPAGGEGWVSYEGTDRAGILSHGSVLASFSKFTDTSPTQRGILVRSRLMCLDIPQPPPTVDADNPPGNADDPNACKADRYAAHTQIASCAACHDLMDPIGLGLENYDIAGVFRTTDDGKPNCTIEGVGALPGVGTFSGPSELADRLIESEILDECVVRTYMSYAQGRVVESASNETVDAMLTSFRDGQFDFAGMVTQYATDELFGFRREPGEG